MTDTPWSDRSDDEPRGLDDAATMTRHEEVLDVERQRVGAGNVTLAKRVETSRHEALVDREVEYGDTEHVEPLEADDGEIHTLEDGSISVPLFEERLVVKKELVVRERVIVRKRVETEQHRVEADLRTEHVEVEGDVDVDPTHPTTH